MAYLFGSAARNKMGSLSDVDIAVLFSEKVKENDYFDRELRLAGEIGKLLKINQIDVVNLKTSSNPTLKHNAVFDGKIIFEKNRKLRFQVESQIMKEYEDTKHLRETQNKIIRRQVKDGIFGKPATPPFSKYLQKYVHK